MANGTRTTVRQFRDFLSKIVDQHGDRELVIRDADGNDRELMCHTNYSTEYDCPGFTALISGEVVSRDPVQ